MTTPQKTVVHVTLPTGEPRGIRIAEIGERTVRAFVVPRSMLGDFGHIGDWTRCYAVYLLVGTSEGAEKPDVYIGETTKLWGRLNEHDRDPDKDFWQTAVALIKTNRSFREDEIKWLELYCIQSANEVNRFHVVNPSTPAPRDEPEGMADVSGTLSILLSVLGYPVFEPAAGVRPTRMLFCRGRAAHATGALVEDGFVVRKDSVARRGIAAGSKKKLAPVRQQLVDDGILVEEEGGLRFTQDYLSSSCSAAAAVVLGFGVNGFDRWKDADGKTLGELKQADGGKQSDDKRPPNAGKRRATQSIKTRVRLKDVIDAAFLQAGKLTARYHGSPLKADLCEDGTIRFQGKPYDTPSRAAVAATGKAQDGWVFWQYQKDGNWILLDVARQAYREDLARKGK